MPLKYPPDLRFAASDKAVPIPEQAIEELYELALKATQGAQKQKPALDSFKSRFGFTTPSSSFDWAIADLKRAMEEAAPNAVTFIDNYWTALEDLKAANIPTPSTKQLNSILHKYNVPFNIKPPKLVRRRNYTTLTDRNEHAAFTAANWEPSSPTKYSLGELLGQGGFGRVYAATRETSVGTFEYAVKVLEPSPFVSNPEKATARFQREIQAIQSLQHRGIVHYFDAGMDNQGRPYLVMPRIRGLNIREASESLDYRQRIILMTEVLDALTHAHANDVLHRDLKPSNILIRSSDHQPIIVDFGHAYIIDELDNNSLTTAAIGSTGYIPSEVQANPKARSPLHDIYSCAVILYELIARKRPDPAEYEPVASTCQRPDLAKIDEVLRKALGSASTRHQTAMTLRTSLLEASEGIY